MYTLAAIVWGVPPPYYRDTPLSFVLGSFTCRWRETTERGGEKGRNRERGREKEREGRQKEGEGRRGARDEEKER